jgi:hypothetical protein
VEGVEQPDESDPDSLIQLQNMIEQDDPTAQAALDAAFSGAEGSPPSITREDWSSGRSLLRDYQDPGKSEFRQAYKDISAVLKDAEEFEFTKRRDLMLRKRDALAELERFQNREPPPNPEEYAAKVQEILFAYTDNTIEGSPRRLPFGQESAQRSDINSESLETAKADIGEALLDGEIDGNQADAQMQVIAEWEQYVINSAQERRKK